MYSALRQSYCGDHSTLSTDDPSYPALQYNAVPPQRDHHDHSYSKNHRITPCQHHYSPPFPSASSAESLSGDEMLSKATTGANGTLDSGVHAFTEQQGSSLPPVRSSTVDEADRRHQPGLHHMHYGGMDGYPYAHSYAHSPQYIRPPYSPISTSYPEDGNRARDGPEHGTNDGGVTMEHVSAQPVPGEASFILETSRFEGAQI